MPNRRKKICRSARQRASAGGPDGRAGGIDAGNLLCYGFCDKVSRMAFADNTDLVFP